MPTTASYVLVFVVAVTVTFAVTPVLRRVAARTGIVAEPNERAVHTEPMPYLGGAAMLIGLLSALGVAWLTGRFEAMFEGTTTVLGIALGAAITCVIGTLDDV